MIITSILVSLITLIFVLQLIYNITLTFKANTLLKKIMKDQTDKTPYYINKENLEEVKRFLRDEF